VERQCGDHPLFLCCTSFCIFFSVQEFVRRLPAPLLPNWLWPGGGQVDSLSARWYRTLGTGTGQQARAAVAVAVAVDLAVKTCPGGGQSPNRGKIQGGAVFLMQGHKPSAGRAGADGAGKGKLGKAQGMVWKGKWRWKWTRDGDEKWKSRYF